MQELYTALAEAGYPVSLTTALAYAYTKKITDESPSLDDSDVVAAPTAGAAAEKPKKKKYHWCATCELPVAQRYEAPTPAQYLAPNYTSVQWVDPIYVPQAGPVCGAASVAGTLRSLAKYHGLPETEAEAVEVRTIQDMYNDMGVPGVYTSTAAVGNATIRRVFMQFAFPSGWVPTVTEFGSKFVTDATARADVNWDRLVKGMQKGCRYLLHCRNHYCRIFGWRMMHDHASGKPALAARWVLMAKKGQRPQHWVPWEALCKDLDTHKGHVILEVKLVERPIAVARKPLEGIEVAAAAAPLTQGGDENAAPATAAAEGKAGTPPAPAPAGKPWLARGGLASRARTANAAAASKEPAILIY